MDETSLKSTDSADGELSRPTVSVRIYVPELNVQKTIQFHREELVWNVKQQCLATLPKVSRPFFEGGKRVLWNVYVVVIILFVCVLACLVYTKNFRLD